jgi:hypothetical protein
MKRVIVSCATILQGLVPVHSTTLAHLSEIDRSYTSRLGDRFTSPYESRNRSRAFAYIIDRKTVEKKEVEQCKVLPSNLEVMLHNVSKLPSLNESIISLRIDFRLIL